MGNMMMRVKNSNMKSLSCDLGKIILSHDENIKSNYHEVKWAPLQRVYFVLVKPFSMRKAGHSSSVQMLLRTASGKISFEGVALKKYSSFLVAES